MVHTPFMHIQKSLNLILVTFKPQNEKHVLLFLMLNPFIHSKCSVSYVPNIIRIF